MISVLLNHGNQPADRIIQIRILFSAGLVHILNGNSVSQFIIGKKFPIPVKNISSGCRKRSLLCDFQLKVVIILFPVHNL